MAADNLKKVKILVLGDTGGPGTSRPVSRWLSHFLALSRLRFCRRGQDLADTLLVLRGGAGKSLLDNRLHGGGQGKRCGISCHSC